MLAIQQVINLSKIPLLAEQSLTASYYQTQAKFIAGFLITSFESSGEYNKAELVAITLESSGTTSLIDNDFRLLEDGGFRLLEDGSRRMLEAA